MSTLKRSRKLAGEFNSNAVDFDVDKFSLLKSDTLVLFQNSNVPKWPLKKRMGGIRKNVFSYFPS